MSVSLIPKCNIIWPDLSLQSLHSQTFSSIQRLKEEAAERNRLTDDAIRARSAEKDRQAAAARRAREEQDKRDLERERKLKIDKAEQEKLARHQLSKQQAQRSNGDDGDSDEADSKARAALVAKFMEEKKGKKNGKLDKLRSQTAKQSISRDLARAKQKAKVMGHKEDFLTRDEKRKAKLQKQIGGSAKLGIGRKPTATSSSPAPASAQKRSAASMDETIALGTHRKDKRSVDEIQRELRAKKQGKDTSVYQKLAAREQERSDALDRRKRAMAGKGRGSRHEDRDDRGNSVQNGSDSDSSDGMVLPKGVQHAEGTRKSNASPGRKSAAASSSSSTARKVNPTDFLPGAPLRPEVAEAAKQREKQLKKLRKEEGGAGSKRSAAREEAREAKRQKRETARERFLRQEKQKQAANGKSKGKATATDETESDEDEDESEDESEDEDESEEESSDDSRSKSRHKGKKASRKDKGSGYRSQIWEIMRAGRGTAKPIEISDSDAGEDSDDMEADLDEVYREEMRSAKIARREDEKELMLEQKHAEEKAKKKRAGKR